MSNRLDEIQKLTFTGAVDADGHILEDAGLWDRYIEAKYKDRAVRVRTDAKGLEYLEVAGKPSKVFSGGRLGGLSAMGATRNDKYGAPPTYGGFAPFGAMDAKERLKRIGEEGLAAAFLYPTMSLLWETETEDPELAQACTRAYNRYIVDFCSESGGKLIPIAHLSLGDPAAAAVELERAVKAGCKGGWVAQFVMTRKPHAHPDHDVLFAKAQELDVPIGIHPSLEPVWAAPGRYDRKFMRGNYYFLNIVAADAIRHAFTSFFQYGTFDKFPKMRLVLLEAGAGWIDYWLGRLDAVYASAMGRTVSLKEKPSFYFNRNCWISADPDERSLPAMVELCGADKFFWGVGLPASGSRRQLYRRSRGAGAQAAGVRTREGDGRERNEGLQVRAAAVKSASQGAAYTTKELSKKTWTDFERLFTRGNGWDFCWCMHFHRSRLSPGCDKLRRAQRSVRNRRDKKALVENRRSHGILVYAEGEPVGWCQYGPQEELPRIDDSRYYRKLAPEDRTEKLWRITCFVVDKKHRRTGVAGFALKAALEAIRKKGGGVVEAYPITRWRPGTFGNQSTNGTATMFEKVGFKIVAPFSRTIHRTNVLMRANV